MPDWIIVVILGIIEGITEFIPVSSTGHLILAENLMKLPDSSFFRTELFNVVIQCGAVLAVLPLFRSRLEQFCTRLNEPAVRDYLTKIIVAFVITGIGGLILKKLGLKLENKPLPIGIALLVGGILFVGIEWWLRGKTLKNEITWTVVIAVGLGQLIAAAFPGSSRSGSTIVLALLLGLARPAATEFSFLVGIPTMLAAGGLEIFEAFHHHTGGASQVDWGSLILATLVAAIVSFIAVKWLLRYVQSHTFSLFGWYRIAIGILILALMR